MSMNDELTHAEYGRWKMALLWLLAAILLTVLSELSHWYRHSGAQGIHHLIHAAAHASLFVRAAQLA